METTAQIQPENTGPENIEHGKLKENGVFGILALILVIANALVLNSLLTILDQRNNTVVKLWEPSQEFLFFAAPTFAFVSIILIWIIAPKASQMKQIFKVTGILAIVLYLGYFIIMSYIFALGSGMRN